jgi:iron-sulfur cluster assembly protein
VLALTPNAVDMIQQIISGPEAPAGAGLRIAAQSPEAGQLTLAVAAAPGQEDQIIEDQGARVFLDPGAAAVLDDKTLDAQADANGVQFFVG